MGRDWSISGPADSHREDPKAVLTHFQLCGVACNLLISIKRTTWTRNVTLSNTLRAETDHCWAGGAIRALRSHSCFRFAGKWQGAAKRFSGQGQRTSGWRWRLGTNHPASRRARQHGSRAFHSPVVARRTWIACTSKKAITVHRPLRDHDRSWSSPLEQRLKTPAWPVCAHSLAESQSEGWRAGPPSGQRRYCSVAFQSLAVQQSPCPRCSTTARMRCFSSSTNCVGS